MGKGYRGSVLWVDLTAGRVWTESIPDAQYAHCLSGAGLAACLLYRTIPAGADPLGPDNVLGFVSGILTGSGSLFTGRWMVVGKSPLTGGWGEANCGGNFSPAIKRCGYDGIFFRGISPKPVVLVVDSHQASLHDARDVWGRDTIDTERLLKQRFADPKTPSVACIGPAGERRSLLAGVVNDGGRLAARSGLGAVMGAKRLKAVVLSGARPIAVYDRQRIRALSRRFTEEVLAYQPEFLSGSMIAFMGKLMRVLPTQMETDGLLYKFMLREWGTVSMNQASIEMGDAPIRNWAGTFLDFDAEKSAPIDPDDITRTTTAKYFCYSCPLGCGGILTPTSDQPEIHRPEYETVLSLGGLLMNVDVDSIFTLNDLLNRAGMDTISVGGTIAFAIECFENGILTRKDTGGLDLTWGNSAAIVALAKQMVRREGLGDLLADGSRVAARRIGKNAERFAVQAGGQELGMHDSRNDPGFAVHYAGDPAPGRHTTGSQLYYEMFRLWKRIPTLPEPSFLYFKGSKYKPDADKAAASAACSRYLNVINGAGCCLFGAFLGADRLPLFDWLDAATGWKRTPRQYLEIGARVQDLKQLFNVKHGIRAQDVVASLNHRAIGRPPQEIGANQGRSVPLEQLVADYWEALGWDRRTGHPARAVLRFLGLAASGSPTGGPQQKGAD